MTGMQMAFLGKWEMAGLAILFSAIFDVLDGRVARMLNIASKFGAELDSLADCVSFGVAPGVILYLWSLQNAGSVGWIAALVLAVCCALRLARFNTMLEDHDLPLWTKSFFTGVPAPAGAGLALLPLFLFLATDGSVRLPSYVVALWVLVSGGLMVSRLPTLALKGRRIAPVWVAPMMVGVGLLVAFLITNTWATLCVVAAMYILSIPIGWYSYHRREKQDQAHA
jgi:CDP-diacylglycerol--serine O-phosphatidyltransferase